VKVIRPPIEIVTSGKVFRPSKAFRNKYWAIQLSIALLFWTVTSLGLMGIGFLVSTIDPSEIPDYGLFLATTWQPVNYWTLIFNLVWLVPAMVVTPIYVRSIEYSVTGQSGETLPEIYVKKGIINITRKHVPFRTITNISSRAGLFDRGFGIGTVEIETAGYSGPQHRGPEEKLEGIKFYEEVRDFILRELRKFREPYTVTTEVVRPHEEPASRIVSTSDDEMLRTLREIRDLLKDQRKRS
jgi:membrane protein YdbS with pleckstrin-like domain